MGFESSGERHASERSTRGGARVAATPWVLATFLLYLGLAIYVLYRAHPHEDAYILFKYARNISEGLGYVYFEGGPPAEGGTDFLWLAALTLLARLGFDVAVAAACLNAAGCALAAALLLRARPASLGVWEQRIFCLLAGGVLFVAGAPAGFAGFSAMLYSALAVYLFACIVSPSERSTRSLPLAAIVVALFRPDGVVLGVGFTLVGLVQAYRYGLLRAYAIRCLVALVIGLGYLAWRIDYFGLLLPLPLYVKSHAVADGVVASILPSWLMGAAGLRPNLLWLLDSAASPLPCVLVASFCLWRFRATRVLPLPRLALALLPLALLFLVLSFAHQTQNVAFRFQAPMALPLFYLMFHLSGHALGMLAKTPSRVFLLGAMGLALMPPMFFASAELTHLIVHRRGYVDTFPARIAPFVDPGTVIALTEAGRMAFWHDAQTIDIVGLNNPTTAVTPATVGYVEGLDPDIVMYNHAHTLDPAAVLGPVRAMVTPFDSASLERMGRPPYPDEGPPGESSRRNPVRHAARVLSQFLANAGSYDTYAVSYQSDYAHILGFRRGMRHQAALDRALMESGEADYQHSYADLARFPFARDVPWSVWER